MKEGNDVRRTGGIDYNTLDVPAIYLDLRDENSGFKVG
jgi:hypothetical protein